MESTSHNRYDSIFPADEPLVTISLPLVKLLQSMETAALLSYIILAQEKNGGEWVGISRDDLGQALVLSAHQVRFGITQLKALGILETKRRAILYRGETASVAHFNVKYDRLEQLLGVDPK